MSDRLPFFLREAQVNLWLADVNLQPSGDAVWFGGFLNRLRSELDYDEVRLKASGNLYATAHHVDEAHLLRFEQSWWTRRADLTDWKPGRNQTYVFQLVWTSGKYWLRRTYYGVTWRSLAMESRSTNQFIVRQSLRARYFQDDHGLLTVGSPQPPAMLPTPADTLRQPVGFFRENAVVQDDYLLGFYNWNTGINLNHARVIAWAPQVSAVVLELEVNGLLTGQQLTLPVGTANTEVTAEADLSGVVAPGQLVRWKVVGAPNPVDSAYNCQLIMDVSQ